MKLVIDFPGLSPDDIPEVSEALDRAGFDREIVGVARKTNLPPPEDLEQVFIEPLS